VVAAGLAARRGDQIELGPALAGAGPELVRADLRATLLQTHDLFRRARTGRALFEGWQHDDEDLLQAQGAVSASAVGYLHRVLFPELPGMPERLAGTEAQLLDVGTGVGAVSIALCRRYPGLRCVGLEPQEAPLRLARRNVAQAGLADRIELRRQTLELLHDAERFDLVWLPLNFLAPAIVDEAFRQACRALRPGGWVVLATLGGGGQDDLASSTARLRCATWGGEPLSPSDVAARLEAAGFVDVRIRERLPSSLTPLHARRPR
jgi:SAM-dependent methyltransferase